MVLEFLLRVSTSRSGKGDEATNMVGRTLASMAAGGIHDPLAGGFARYGVDRAWVVPHFEKMLYDNGQLLSVYARWALLNDDEDAARVARGIADFMLAELGTDEGAFASALDADSEGEEGPLYVWTLAQLVDVLGAEDGAWAAELLTVTERGTFEGGTSTLQLREQPEDRQRWESCRERLLTARAKRVRPERDDKVVAAWNGLAISGLVDAGICSGSRRTSKLRCGVSSSLPIVTSRTGGCCASRVGESRARMRASSRTTAASPSGSWRWRAPRAMVRGWNAPVRARHGPGALRGRGRRIP